MHFTPVKRLFIRLEVSRALGKRHRGEDIETHDPGAKNRKGVTDATSRNAVATKHTHGSTPPSIPVTAQIALQHEDCSENAIVITALDKIPFCCHEDLLTMSRVKLQEVAASLNAKLPASMRIDVAPLRTDREIRKDIEVAVGITENVPGAPKANRRANATPTRNDKQAESVTPLSSPLASKSRIYGVYTPSPGLGRLDEADEEDFSQDRQSKRRKVAAMNTFMNEIDDVFTSKGSNKAHQRVLQNTFSASSSLRVQPTQSTPYHNLVQVPSAQPKRKRRPTNQLVTSSSVAAQNNFLTPMQTSTPRKCFVTRSTLGGSPLRSPLRSPRRNTKGVSVEDDPDAIALMSGMYGMRMCESYDGDFLDMDVDT